MGCWRRAHHGALLGLVIVLTLAGCNLPEAPYHLGGTIPIPDGCPDLANEITRINERRQPPPGREVTAAEPTTAVDVWGRRAPAQVNLPRMGRFLANFHQEYPVVAQGRLASIGVTVEIRSDGPLTVDMRELDELVLVTLNTAYPDPRFRALMDCYRMRLLSDRELKGTALRIYLPSDPTACFQAGTIMPRGEGGCDAIGAAIPGLRVRTVMAGANPLSLRWPSTVIVTPGHHPTLLETVEARAALTMVHEFVHYLDNVMGVTPHPSRMKEYERRAYYAQSVIRLRVVRGEIDLPQPFIWPRRQIPESADDPRA
jgi:hypothetical protein